jgi:hypothetical protein
MREMTSPGVWTDMGPQPAVRHVHGFSTLGGSIVTSRKAPNLGIVTNGELIRHRRQHAKRHAASLTATHSASRIIGVSSNDDPEAHP